ncbi:MAG: type II toxin-antitoxin system HicB family antitoxin [Patescibacteria group bacterium]
MSKFSNHKVPLIVEKDEDNFYVVECPLFEGCYAQGKTLDEALKNIRAVIKMILKDDSNRQVYSSYNPQELSLHTISV